MPNATFESWLAKVDSAVVRRIGLGVDDLEDFPYYDLFEDGMTPAETARLVLEAVL